MRCPAKCRRVGMADDADSKSVGGNTVWVQVPPPAPRRNGLRSIQKAQPKGWAFLIPLRHSSFSPRNFASQIFAGALAALPGGKRASCVSLAATFLQKIIVRLFCCSSLPRPVGRQHTALHSKSPAPWPGFLCCSPFKAARPAARAFPGENAHGSTVLLAHLCRHSKLRGVTFV